VSGHNAIGNIRLDEEIVAVVLAIWWSIFG
jgi:hypothetical protein